MDPATRSRSPSPSLDSLITAAQDVDFPSSPSPRSPSFLTPSSSPGMYSSSPMDQELMFIPDEEIETGSPPTHARKEKEHETRHKIASLLRRGRTSDPRRPDDAPLGTSPPKKLQFEPTVTVYDQHSGNPSTHHQLVEKGNTSRQSSPPFSKKPKPSDHAAYKLKYKNLRTKSLMNLLHPESADVMRLPEGETRILLDETSPIRTPIHDLNPYEVIDSLIKLRRQPDHLFKYLQNIEIEGLDQFKHTLEKTAFEEGKTLKDFFCELFDTFYSSGYFKSKIEENKDFSSEATIESQVDLLLDLAEYKESPSKKMRGLSHYIPLFPLLQCLNPIEKCFTESVKALFPALFPETDSQEVSAAINKERLTRHRFKVGVSPFDTIKVHIPKEGKAEITQIRRYNIKLLIDQPSSVHKGLVHTRHRAAKQTAVKIGKLDVVFKIFQNASKPHHTKTELNVKNMTCYDHRQLTKEQFNDETIKKHFDEASRELEAIIAEHLKHSVKEEKTKPNSPSFLRKHQERKSSEKKPHVSHELPEETETQISSEHNAEQYLEPKTKFWHKIIPHSSEKTIRISIKETPKSKNPISDMSPFTVFDFLARSEMVLSDPARLNPGLLEIKRVDGTKVLIDEVTLPKNLQSKSGGSKETVEETVPVKKHKSKSDGSKAPADKTAHVKHKHNKTMKDLFSEIFHEIYSSGYFNKEISDDTEITGEDAAGVGERNMLPEHPFHEIAEGHPSAIRRRNTIPNQLSLLFNLLQHKVMTNKDMQGINEHIPLFSLLQCLNPIPTTFRTALPALFPKLFPGPVQRDLSKIVNSDRISRYYLLASKYHGENEKTKIKVLGEGKAKISHLHRYEISLFIHQPGTVVDDPIQAPFSGTKHTKIKIGKFDAAFTISHSAPWLEEAPHKKREDQSPLTTSELKIQNIDFYEDEEFDTGNKTKSEIAEIKRILAEAKIELDAIFSEKPKSRELEDGNHLVVKKVKVKHPHAT